jgi:ATP adenylyltransferase
VGDDVAPEDRHVLLFNRFCLVPNHLLVITKEYERQEAPVRASTFAAIAGVIGELDEQPDVDWLCFFNCGKASSASQHHKHLQLLPMVKTRVPVEDALPAGLQAGQIGMVPAFSSFRHGFVWLEENTGEASGAQWKRHYDALMEHLDNPEAYNLVFTPRWMMVVPRRAAACPDGLSFNSLAYAGLIMVKSEAELEHLRTRPGGPIAVLRELAFPL